MQIWWKHRNAWLMSASQALYVTGFMIVGTFSGLIGQQLAPSAVLATLPIALLIGGNILFSLSLSLLMQKYGRPAGFALGALAGCLGAGLGAWALILKSFWFFCLAHGVLGIWQAAAQYYRLAAVDQMEAGHRGKILSLVLGGGVLGALLAPSVALWSRDLWEGGAYVGSYLALGGISFLLLPIIFILKDAPERFLGETSTEMKRSLRQIGKQPIFQAALVNAAVAHAVMILAMNSAPLAMVAEHHSLEHTAQAIRIHVLGMYLPSFFTGWMIDRLGAPKIAGVGALLLIVSVFVSASGVNLHHFNAGLLFLGLGWNLMYLSGTALLTAACEPHERGKVQGSFEMLIAISAALASFSSAGAFHWLGWMTLNLGALPLLFGSLWMTFWLSRRHTFRT